MAMVAASTTAAASHPHPHPSRPIHALAIPYPAQGHINPMLQLCQLLVPHGFTFTFVVTRHIDQRLRRLNATPESPGCRDEVDAEAPPPPIRMVSVDGGVPPEIHAYADHHKKVDPFKASQEMMAPVEEFVASLQAGGRCGATVDFIIADVLLGWVHAKLAPKLDLPSVAFWAASAATFSTVVHFTDVITAAAAATAASDPSLAAEAEAAAVAAAAAAAAECGAYDGIPGLPPTESHYMPRIWDVYGKPREHVIKFIRDVVQARLLLLNSFPELEASCIEALNLKMETIAVGPLIPPEPVEIEEEEAAELEVVKAERFPSPSLMTTSLRRLSLFPEDDTCLRWLETQAPGSVLFISFGSISVRSTEQMAALSEALRGGGTAPPFLWVCRPEVEGVEQYVSWSSEDPDRKDGSGGFKLQAEAENGRVVRWAPQVAVLRHEAVGGFLTHCGWNSVMEAVACGVPMLCWADMYERMSNQRFVVDVWGCGMDLAPDRRAAADIFLGGAEVLAADHIRRVINEFMNGDTGRRVRRRSALLRNTSAAAFRRSSHLLSQLAGSLFPR